MSTQHPGGDPRFGAPLPPATNAFGTPVAPAPGVPAPAGAAPTGPGARAGFVSAPRPVPAPSPRLGAPRWLWPVVGGVAALLALLAAGIWWQQGRATDELQRVFKHTSVAVAPSVDGLELGDGPGVAGAQQRAQLALAQTRSVAPASGVYVTPDGSSYALVAAAKRATATSALTSTADDTADHFATGIGAGPDAAPVTLSDQPVGALGGVMRCGAVSVSGTPATLCVAADEGAIVETVVATSDVATAADFARAARQAFVTRTQ